MEFRLREAQVAVHHAKHRALACRFFEFRNKVTQHFDVRSLQHKLHREATALRTNALRFKHHHAQIRVFVTEHLNHASNFTLRTTSLLIVVQEQTHSRVARIPSTRLEFRVFIGIENRSHFIDKFIGHALGAREVHAFGHAHVHHHSVGVFGRRHFATHVIKAEIGPKQENSHNREQQQAPLEESAKQT